MDKKEIELEILRWKTSVKRRMMLDGERYYRGNHDILKRRRTVIGKDGKIEEVYNLPNNKIIDNQYAKVVDQKVNYLLGKPLTFDVDDKNYLDELSSIFNRKFYRTLRNVGEDILNCGIGYIHLHYDEKSNLVFRRFDPYEILPFWIDAEIQIQKEIDAWYGRFADNNGITINEAKRLLNSKELDELKWDVNKYIEIGRENAINQKWLKELENASSKLHINRLDAIKLRIQQIAEIAYGNQLDLLDDMSKNIFRENYYHTIFEIQKV